MTKIFFIKIHRQGKRKNLLYRDEGEEKMSNKKDSLGDRMKTYEYVSRTYLTRRTPVIIRIDGKAFHTFTKGFERPFDEILIQSMQNTAKYLCENIQGCKMAYTQSDEISLLLVDYDTIDTCPWFDNNIQKMVSIAASMATLAFNKSLSEYVKEHAGKELYDELLNVYCNAVDKGAIFDARVFILPKEEVCNYFIWRQQDCTRNSIQMAAQANFSHKELEGKSCDVLQDMLHEQKGINWNDFITYQKRGSCVVKEQYEIADANFYHMVTRTRWMIDKDIPIFTQNRNYIDEYVFLDTKGEK